MAKIGFVGWRGMVGSVLRQRMTEENDWEHYPDKLFFSTSQIPRAGWPFDLPVEDSNDLDQLSACDIIVTCQGGDWTNKYYPRLRNECGWKGIFIDASSALRTDPDSVIVLDPVNRFLIDRRLEEGCRTFVGGNCTTSLMLMALHGLFKAGLVESLFSSTYQAASGAGAAHMEELLVQMNAISRDVLKRQLELPTPNALDLERTATAFIRERNYKDSQFGAPLALSLIPWIDKGLDSGQTKEEWKMMQETIRILDLPSSAHFLADGTCVRVPVLRSHSQALVVNLKREVPPGEIEAMLAAANPYVEIVPNLREETLLKLSPAYVTGTLKVVIGRIHPTVFSKRMIKAFTSGDQLLWGAAEPIRRILRIVNKIEP